MRGGGKGEGRRRGVGGQRRREGRASEPVGGGHLRADAYTLTRRTGSAPGFFFVFAGAPLRRTQQPTTRLARVVRLSTLSAAARIVEGRGELPATEGNAKMPARDGPAAGERAHQPVCSRKEHLCGRRRGVLAKDSPASQLGGVSEAGPPHFGLIRLVQTFQPLQTHLDNELRRPYLCGSASPSHLTSSPSSPGVGFSPTRVHCVPSRVGHGPGMTERSAPAGVPLPLIALL